MSLMKKMARIIQRDLQKKSTRQEKHENNDNVDSSQKNDYVYAAAYKDEQQHLWKSLYRYLYEMVDEQPVIKPTIDSLKGMIHNYCTDEDGNPKNGSKYQRPSSAAAWVNGLLNTEYANSLVKEKNGQYPESVMYEFWRHAVRTIDEIDWTESE